MSENINKKVTSNLLWRLMERFGAQGVTFVVSIVLARLLDPTIYGIVALITVFTSILQVFVDSGMGDSLIQKKDADDLDFSSVFYFNVVFCITLYLVMFFVAPLIANFYDYPDLTPVIRVASLTIVISGVKNVQQAYVAKNMMFKRFFFSTLAGTIGAAALGITLAYLGFGVWALVAQSLFNLTVDTIVLWITVKWRPKWMFSYKRLRGLFSYGWKLFVSALLNTGYNELRSLIIGKRYSADNLGYYNKGEQFPKLIVSNINISIDSVMLPTMSSEQDNVVRVKAMTRRAIKTSTFLIMPMMVGLAVCAEPLVRLVLTEKWLPCVLFLRIFCFSYAFYPVATTNLNAMKALGRSDYFLVLEIIKKTIGFTAILITMWISVEAMAYSIFIVAILGQIVNAWPNKKLLGYGYFDQLKDMAPQIIIAAIMGASVYCITFAGLNDIITLVIQVLTGFAVYVGLSALFKLDSFYYCFNVAKSYIHKGKKNKQPIDDKAEKENNNDDLTKVKDSVRDDDSTFTK